MSWISSGVHFLLVNLKHKQTNKKGTSWVGQSGSLSGPAAGSVFFPGGYC